MYKGVQNYHDRSFMPRIASKATIHVRTCDRSLKHIKGPKTISTKCLCGTSSPYTIDCILSCIVWICLKLIFKLKRAALHVTTFVQGNFSLNSFPTLPSLFIDIHQPPLSQRRYVTNNIWNEICEMRAPHLDVSMSWDQVCVSMCKCGIKTNYQHTKTAIWLIIFLSLYCHHHLQVNNQQDLRWLPPTRSHNTTRTTTTIKPPPPATLATNRAQDTGKAASTETGPNDVSGIVCALEELFHFFIFVFFVTN
jgi:hypothetical protein